MTINSKRRRQYQEIALRRIHQVRRDVTINEFRSIYEEEGFWPEEDPRHAQIEVRNKELRQLARNVPIIDDQGQVRELVNIKRGKRADDGRQQVFIFLDQTDKPDLQWLIGYHVRRSRQAGDQVERYLGEYQRRFGKQASNKLRQKLLWPEPPG
jgi:hypothetical protein